MCFGYELISETDRLHNFPELGRIVPEYRNDCIREIIFRPYRIVYRVNHDAKLYEIARVWHFGAKNTAVVTGHGCSATANVPRLDEEVIIAISETDSLKFRGLDLFRIRAKEPNSLPSSRLQYLPPYMF